MPATTLGRPVGVAVSPRGFSGGADVGINDEKGEQGKENQKGKEARAAAGNGAAVWARGGLCRNLSPALWAPVQRHHG